MQHKIYKQSGKLMKNLFEGKTTLEIYLISLKNSIYKKKQSW